MGYFVECVGDERELQAFPIRASSDLCTQPRGRWRAAAWGGREQVRASVGGGRHGGGGTMLTGACVLTALGGGVP